MKPIYYSLLILGILINSCSNNKEAINVKLLSRTAKFYYQQSNYEEAFKAYDRLLEIDSLNSEYYFNRGRCEMVLLMYDNSRKDFLKSIGFAYREADAYYNIGVTYILVNDSLAKEYFQKCLRIDPDHVYAKVMIDSLKL
jgi:tetratricopeptide (TPR) repeat protein